MSRNRLRYWILPADLVWISAALLWALSIRFGSLWQRSVPNHAAADVAVILMSSAIIWTLLYFVMDLDGLDWASDLPGRTSFLLLAVGCFISLLAASSYFTREYFSRLALGYFGILVFGGFVASRWLILRLLSSAQFPGAVRRVVILGDGRLARELVQKFENHPELRCRVIGCLSSGTEGRPGAAAPTRMSTLHIIEFLQANRVTDLMLVPPAPMPREVLSLIARCQAAGIKISLVPQLYELYTSRPRLIEVGGVPLLTLDQHGTPEWPQIMKAVPDRLLALLLLVACSPLLLIAALYLRRTGRKVFQCELRCGRDGVPFRMHRLNIDRDIQHAHRLESALSNTGMTELPQLWNVLRGEMSLVGPRPESPARVKHYSEWHRQRLRVKPGITGYAQVQGLRDQHSSEEKTRFDLQYILNWSPVLDLAIVLQTAWVVVRRAGMSLKRSPYQRVDQYQHRATEV
jgi:lipopolysaccharide/colanic/teichoic acid biosynthesis glycosyltransferase